MDFGWFSRGDGDLWSNIEESLEIDYYSLMEYSVSNYGVNFLDDNPGWSDILSFTSNETDFIEDFTGKYFVEWLRRSYHPVGKIYSLSKDDLYLTFNYTNTLEDSYGIPEKSILHIHGSLNKIKNHFTNQEIREEIQFGCGFDPEYVNDEFEEMYEDSEYWGASISFGASEIIQACQSVYKDVKGNFLKLKNFISKFNVTQIIVMGLSCGVYDLPYLEEINNKFPNVNWIFYYHTDTDLDKCQEFIKNNGIINYQLQ
jgi:hypothetical protein